MEELAGVFGGLGTGVLVVGSLPYSLRPDLEIQSVGKNTYYYSKGGSPELLKGEQNGTLKPLKLLIE